MEDCGDWLASLRELVYDSRQFRAKFAGETCRFGERPEPAAGNDVKSQGAPIVNHAEPRRGKRGLACLLWGAFAFVCLLIAGAVLMGAVYAGWNSGLATARAQASITAEAYARQQCERIPLDLAAGNPQLAQKRFEELLKQERPPGCLFNLAPTATAAFLLSATSPSPPPATVLPPTPTARPHTATPPSASSDSEPSSEAGYDLNALLEEARNCAKPGRLQCRN